MTSAMLQPCLRRALPRASHGMAMLLAAGCAAPDAALPDAAPRDLQTDTTARFEVTKVGRQLMRASFGIHLATLLSDKKKRPFSRFMVKALRRASTAGDPYLDTSKTLESDAKALGQALLKALAEDTGLKSGCLSLTLTAASPHEHGSAEETGKLAQPNPFVKLRLLHHPSSCEGESERSTDAETERMSSILEGDGGDDGDETNKPVEEPSADESVSLILRPIALGSDVSAWLERQPTWHIGAGFYYRGAPAVRVHAHKEIERQVAWPLRNEAFGALINALHNLRNTEVRIGPDLACVVANPPDTADASWARLPEAHGVDGAELNERLPGYVREYCVCRAVDANDGSQCAVFAHQVAKQNDADL